MAHRPSPRRRRASPALSPLSAGPRCWAHPLRSPLHCPSVSQVVFISDVTKDESKKFKIQSVQGSAGATTDFQEDIIILGFGRVGQAVLQSLLAYCSAQVIQILFFLTHLFFFSYQVQCILYMVEAERYRSSVLF